MVQSQLLARRCPPPNGKSFLPTYYDARTPPINFFGAHAGVPSQAPRHGKRPERTTGHLFQSQTISIQLGRPHRPSGPFRPRRPSYPGWAPLVHGSPVICLNHPGDLGGGGGPARPGRSVTPTPRSQVEWRRCPSFESRDPAELSSAARGPTASASWRLSLGRQTLCASSATAASRRQSGWRRLTCLPTIGGQTNGPGAACA